jgi:hypothetical protein
MPSITMTCFPAIHFNIILLSLPDYSKMYKAAKDKLVGSPGENGGDRMSKKIFTQELEGTRRRGRHRKEWREEVERDLQVLGVRRWRELVIDREKWKDIVRQAKAHSGLCRQRKRMKKFKLF